MDLLTHIVLGACIGEAVFSKKLDKKALVIGAIAQTLPDIDVLASFWLSPTENLLFHRSITHSFLFGILAALLLSFLAKRMSGFQQVSYKKLLLFFCLQMWLHDLLDTCNAYGTGLLEPFSHQRYSINLLFVVDPFFTVPILIAFVALIILKKQNPNRKKWLLLGLLVPCLYLFYASFNKVSVNRQVKKSLLAQQIHYKSVIVTPTFFNTWLWYIVAETDSGYFVGYRSVFDEKNYNTSFTYYPRNEQLLKTTDTSKNVRQLIQFADNFYSIENRNDTLVFNVLRFGQEAGWENIKTHFTFHYFLNPAYNNSMVVQRGRFKEWNLKTFASMYHRIKGFK